MRKTIDWNSVSSRAVRKGISVIGLVALAIVAQADPQVLIDWKAPTKPRSKMATFSVGSDRALIFLRDEHQRDLLTLQKAGKQQQRNTSTDTLLMVRASSARRPSTCPRE